MEEIIKNPDRLVEALYDLERGETIFAKKGLFDKVKNRVVGKSFTRKELQDKDQITCTH